MRLVTAYCFNPICLKLVYETLVEEGEMYAKCPKCGHANVIWTVGRLRELPKVGG